MSNDEFLYNSFMSMLFDLDSKHHSCLNDLSRLKNYRQVMETKLENENDEDGMKGSYAGIYRHHIRAERMRHYLEQNIAEYYAVNQWDLFVRLKNGDKFIYDSFDNIVKFDLYSNELTDEEEDAEFAKNLKKIMRRRFRNQEQLAKETGIDRISISRYVSGKRMPDGSAIRKLAKALNCSPNDFYYRHF